MATSGIPSTGLNVSNLGGSTTPLQITGLASGLDTNSIIQELMAIDRQPLTNLQNQQKGVQALNTNLSGIQSALQNLASSAQALSATTLFSNSQTANSSNPSAVSATTTSNVGAVVGGYQVAVTALAGASQSTYGFTSQSVANTVTVNSSTAGTGAPPNTYSLAAGATAQDLANAVNADNSGSVWATVVNGNIVFSDRTTGSQSSFTVSDSAGALSASPLASSAGHDAAYTINGGAPQTSASNTVANAIPGVTLTLSGLTGTGTPATVNVSPPSISTSAVQNAVQSFVGAYNSVLSQITTQLGQRPVSTDPTQGTLYQDPGLQGLLTNMRQAMYTGGSGLPAGMASMMDIGVSTGSASSGPLNQNAIGGQLALNAATLTQAIQTNPSGVTAVLKSWSQNFATLVNAVAAPGGTIDSRVQGDNSQISFMASQISTMQSGLNDKQAALQQQFANLEAALSENQSTSSWLTSQLNSLSSTH